MRAEQREKRKTEIGNGGEGDKRDWDWVSVAGKGWKMGKGEKIWRVGVGMATDDFVLKFSVYFVNYPPSCTGVLNFGNVYTVNDY